MCHIDWFVLLGNELVELVLDHDLSIIDITNHFGPIVGQVALIERWKVELDVV